jgi:Icc-related predicted phosphoesterase
MKFIREASDLHLDFDISLFSQTRTIDRSQPQTIKDEMDMLWVPPSMDGDLDTTFIVAGDIWTDRRFATRKFPGTSATWISQMSRRFKYVVLVLGNHDYWGTNLNTEPGKVKAAIAAQGLTNVFLLERDVLVLDQVKFVGGTLWTNYNNGNPMIAYQSTVYMNDYKYMRTGPSYRKVRPDDLLQIFQETKNFIFENATRDDPEQKLVVVTHMAPSEQSVDTMYREARHFDTNYFYFSDLEREIEANGQIDLYFHGHMHSSKRYKIGDTEVILNPRGYNDENPLFDERLRIEL